MNNNVDDPAVILDVEIGHSVCPEDETEDNCVLNKVAAELNVFIKRKELEAELKGFKEAKEIALSVFNSKENV